MCRISLGRTRCVALLLIASTACIGLRPTSAIAGAQPSPFAGCYADGSISISDRGRISSSSSGVRVSGRIWDDGYMELTVKTGDLNIGRSRGKPVGESYTLTAAGIGALDEYGNLYGVLQWDDGNVGPFFWPRCD